MFLSAVPVLVGAQSSSEIPEGLMNNPVYHLLMNDPVYHLLLILQWILHKSETESISDDWQGLYWTCSTAALNI